MAAWEDDPIQPKGYPQSFDYDADEFDAVNVDGFPDDAGDVLVISEKSKGAYIISDLSATEWLENRRTPYF